eukprot:13645398-Alexandrium_andersonii.AAC.1
MKVGPPEMPARRRVVGKQRPSELLLGAGQIGVLSSQASGSLAEAVKRGCLGRQAVLRMRLHTLRGRKQ